MIVKMTCHITWVFLLEMESLRGPKWSSAAALASLVKSCVISCMNTEDWGHLFPVVPNSECMKAPMSLMWGLLHFTSIWKWRWMVVVCRQNKRTAACMGLTEVGPSKTLKAPLDLCILYFPDNFANEIIKPCGFFIGYAQIFCYFANTKDMACHECRISYFISISMFISIYWQTHPGIIVEIRLFIL